MKTFKRQRDFEKVNKIAPKSQATRSMRHLLVQPPVLVPYTRNFDKVGNLSMPSCSLIGQCSLISYTSFCMIKKLAKIDFLFSISTTQAEVTDWISGKHNMGMVLTKKDWLKILNCSNTFCKVLRKHEKKSKLHELQYDDYNWDWSLQQVSNKCLSRKLQVMMMKGPRVFHIGEW